MKSKSLEYNITRSSPKLEGIVESCSKYELSRSDFPYVEEPKSLPNMKSKNYQISSNVFGSGGDNEDEDQPNLIIFVLGGISHNEICALERLSTEKKINHHLVIGGTSILSASQYIDQLKDLSVPNDSYGTDFEGAKNIELSDIELAVRK